MASGLFGHNAGALMERSSPWRIGRWSSAFIGFLTHQADRSIKRPIRTSDKIKQLIWGHRTLALQATLEQRDLEPGDCQGCQEVMVILSFRREGPWVRHTTPRGVVGERSCQLVPHDSGHERPRMLVGG
jgi:hypothetical protein